MELTEEILEEYLRAIFFDRKTRTDIKVTFTISDKGQILDIKYSDGVVPNSSETDLDIKED
jgi:hypothetical protein